MVASGVLSHLCEGDKRNFWRFIQPVIYSGNYLQLAKHRYVSQLQKDSAFSLQILLTLQVELAGLP